MGSTVSRRAGTRLVMVVTPPGLLLGGAGRSTRSATSAIMQSARTLSTTGIPRQRARPAFFLLATHDPFTSVLMARRWPQSRQ